MKCRTHTTSKTAIDANIPYTLAATDDIVQQINRELIRVPRTGMPFYSYQILMEHCI